jgi:uncharacterized Zn finger protein (UPF0148 family)
MMSKGKIDSSGSLKGNCPECGAAVWTDRPQTCSCPRCGRMFQMVKSCMANRDLAAIKSKLRYITARA